MTVENLFTVAVRIPGTDQRVLVERLKGCFSPEEATDYGLRVVLQLVDAQPLAWQAEVVKTEQITDVHLPLETT